MRQIKYILIDDSGRKNRESHYTINSKGFVTESTDIRKAVKVIDRQVDPDGYNASSIVISLAGSKVCSSSSQAVPFGQAASSSRDSLKDLLVELRKHFPEAMIFSIREIGDYFIKVSDEMNQLRLELSEMP